jgi:(5-formylfuran-3-yl)methyl phosphate transaminase
MPTDRRTSKSRMKPAGRRAPRTAARPVEELGAIRPFIVMDVLERAQALERQGRSVIHLEVGEPDFPTPPVIVQAAIEALRNGDTRYTDSRGIAELRAAVARYHERRYGVRVAEERVFITGGVSPALLLVLSILLENPGGEIIMGDPAYACYPNFVRYLKGAVRAVATAEEDGFQLTPAQVKAATGPRTRAVLINSPSNPTGTLIPEKDLEAICGLGVPVISDEIYHGLVYEGRVRSALEFSDEAFVLNGFSKRFAMTGWRLGYVIAPARFIRPLQILQQNFFISPNSFVQRAAIAALREDPPELEEMRIQYDARRRFLLKALPTIGLRFAVEPKGAFYFFVDASHVDGDSYRLAFDILEKAGVAVTPGIDFGERGEGHLRISYANSLERIGDGLRRLGAYLDERGALKR